MPIIQEDQKKKRNERIVSIVVFSVLGVAILTGLIILFIWLANKAKELPLPDDSLPQEQEEVIDDKSSEYNRLLQLVNTEVNNYSYTPATSVVSFDYKDDKFYISARNEYDVYNYEIDMTSISYPTIEEAIEYLLDNDPTSSMAKALEKSSVCEIPSNFFNKYLAGDKKSWSAATEVGEKIYITSTIYDKTSKDIKVIYDTSLDILMDDSYIVTTIEQTSEVYPIYKYIAYQ